MKYLIVFSLLFTISHIVKGQNTYPTIEPTAFYVEANGTEKETTTMVGSAPIVGTFRANPANNDGWESKYEWRFTREGETEPYLIRYEEETEVTFTEAYQTTIVCYATFIGSDTTVYYREEYWEDPDHRPFTCSPSTSKLNMPNAFSPNGDGINDIYKPKKDYQSIVEFRAIIFNRWGQKLYEWTDPSTGWDGTFNGSPVKDGVYYCLVKARGSDGIKYSFKKDVNLLRGFSEKETNSSDQ